MADKIQAEKTKPTRRPAPFSFFRSVSKEAYERQNSQYVLGIRLGEAQKIYFCDLSSLSSPTLLKDGATPIVVIDTDDILNSLQKATIRCKSEKENGAAAAIIDANNNPRMVDGKQ